MSGVLGLETGVNVPTINISGFFSSNWIYITIIILLAIILIGGVSLLLFYTTYNKKIIVFENISGQGYQPVLRTRARSIKLSIGGGEVLKTLRGGTYISAYGKKMGKNTFWYAKAEDGYLYNITIGDLDTKKAMLDIDPVDRDVRMMHEALDRMAKADYDPRTWIEKNINKISFFLILVVLILGLWAITSNLKEATKPFSKAGENAIKIQEANDKTIAKIDSLLRTMGYISENKKIDEGGGSGLVEAKT